VSPVTRRPGKAREPVTQVVVGHANPDFDAYAAMVAATKLYPGSKAVFLGSQNANVREFHNLHEDFLEFVDLKQLDLAAVRLVVMVDTRDPDRIGEIGRVSRRPGVEVVVYDHHPHSEGDDFDPRPRDTRSWPCAHAARSERHASRHP
jgi:tRNA nucleotidyltransferase (CCA-adding enzyme)